VSTVEETINNGVQELTCDDRQRSVKIQRYLSLKDYENHFLLLENVSDLKGCFEKDGVLGQIRLSTFNISIKSLVTDFAYSKNLKISQWAEICGYMKRQIIKSTNNPKQLVDAITRVFEKKALRDQQETFDISMLGLERYSGYFNTVQKRLNQLTMNFDSSGAEALQLQNLKKRLNLVQQEFMRMQNRSKLITVNPIFNRKEYLGKNTEPLPVERYLIEVTYPQVSVAYKDKLYAKQLDEVDIEYLVRARFQKWMQFIINSHFRLELNVGKDQPIPRLQEFLTEEEKLATKKLLMSDFELQDAMLRDDVQFSKNRALKLPERDGKDEQAKDAELGQTRSKLSKWFPV